MLCSPRCGDEGSWELRAEGRELSAVVAAQGETGLGYDKGAYQLLGSGRSEQ